MSRCKAVWNRNQEAIGQSQKRKGDQMLQKRIGMRIREVRELSGMTQKDLADRIHVSRSSVESWECGQTYPSIDNCVALSETFHLSTDYFFAARPCKKVILDQFSERETQMIYEILAFFDEKKKGRKRPS